ncbi:FkbM family methyltransferase [Caulobacter sp. KR2-114]|uniref:FkbM family methyltransferase n=1 Tax=Caulobacter sp. KR2-114 TaxID=3400912 RepID=UPI003C01BD5F
MSDNEGAAALVAKLTARLDRLDERFDALERMIGEVRQLVGPFAVPLAPDRLLVQTLHGLKFMVDPTDLIMTPQLVVYRQWEPDLSAYLNRTLGEASVFVDVGANFGYFTCLAGARIGAHGAGRVIAVEPNPAMLALLDANLAINWSMCPIDVARCAAGPRAGEATLWAPASRAANASLSGPDATGEPGAAVSVALRPLDEIVPAGLPVDVMKVDVEGHEFGVLRGATRVIGESPDLRLILEWSQSQMQEAGYDPAALLTLLRDHGLVPHALEQTGHLGERLTDDVLMSTAYANLIFRRD